MTCDATDLVQIAESYEQTVEERKAAEKANAEQYDEICELLKKRIELNAIASADVDMEAEWAQAARHAILSIEHQLKKLHGRKATIRQRKAVQKQVRQELAEAQERNKELKATLEARHEHANQAALWEKMFHDSQRQLEVATGARPQALDPETQRMIAQLHADLDPTTSSVLQESGSQRVSLIESDPGAAATPVRSSPAELAEFSSPEEGVIDAGDLSDDEDGLS
jgi:hypothetical protein